jgi:hypothetical protein
MGLVGADRVFWMSTVQVMVVDLVSVPLRRPPPLLQ